MTVDVDRLHNVVAVDRVTIAIAVNKRILYTEEVRCETFSAMEPPILSGRQGDVSEVESEDSALQKSAIYNQQQEAAAQADKNKKKCSGTHGNTKSQAELTEYVVDRIVDVKKMDDEPPNECNGTGGMLNAILENQQTTSYNSSSHATRSDVQKEGGNVDEHNFLRDWSSGKVVRTIDNVGKSGQDARRSRLNHAPSHEGRRHTSD